MMLYHDGICLVLDLCCRSGLAGSMCHTELGKMPRSRFVHPNRETGSQKGVGLCLDWIHLEKYGVKI